MMKVFLTLLLLCTVQVAGAKADGLIRELEPLGSQGPHISKYWLIKGQDAIRMITDGKIMAERTILEDEYGGWQKSLVVSHNDCLAYCIILAHTEIGGTTMVRCEMQRRYNPDSCREYGQ